MARKSRELRLSQSTDLLASYEAAGLDSDYRYRFIRDMISRLDRSKGLSAKQRSWLDSLIDEGVPAPKGDPQLIERIREAADLDGMQHRRQALHDFMGTVTRGYDLSEKQSKFLAVMLAEADKVHICGKFQPANPDRLVTAVTLLSAKNDWYWGHRQGTAKAYEKVRSWIEWNTRREVIQDVEASGKESVHVLGEEPHIDEWSCDKVLKAAKTGLAEIDNPRHEVGSLRYIRRGGAGIPVMIMSAPRVLAGEVQQDLLIDGEMVACYTSKIRKRK